MAMLDLELKMLVRGAEPQAPARPAGAKPAPSATTPKILVIMRFGKALLTVMWWPEEAIGVHAALRLVVWVYDKTSLSSSVCI